MMTHFKCHPRESGGPGRATLRLPWIPAFQAVRKPPSDLLVRNKDSFIGPLPQERFAQHAAKIRFLRTGDHGRSFHTVCFAGMTTEVCLELRMPA